MAKTKKHGKRIEAVLSELRKGQLLCFGMEQRKYISDYYYWLEPSSKRVGCMTAHKIIALGLVEPNSDAFPFGSSQSWRLVQ